MQAIFYNNFSKSFIPHILHEIYIEKVYSRFISDLDPATSTVLDIGGNIGLFSNFIKDYANKVYMLEPANEHVICAKKMFEFNNVPETKVEVIQKALSNENGKANFNHSDNTTMYSLDSSVNNTNQSEEVETITMSKLFKDYNITSVDLMKLDVEGFEFKVLTSKEFQEVCLNIKNIVVEYHSWSKTNPNHLISMLQDYGYKTDRIPANAMLISARR